VGVHLKIGVKSIGLAYAPYCQNLIELGVDGVTLLELFNPSETEHGCLSMDEATLVFKNIGIKNDVHCKIMASHIRRFWIPRVLTLANPTPTK